MQSISHCMTPLAQRYCAWTSQKCYSDSQLMDKLPFDTYCMCCLPLQHHGQEYSLILLLAKFQHQRFEWEEHPLLLLSSSNSSQCQDFELQECHYQCRMNSRVATKPRLIQLGREQVREQQNNKKSSWYILAFPPKIMIGIENLTCIFAY